MKNIAGPDAAEVTIDGIHAVKGGRGTVSQLMSAEQNRSP
jgi:hypothetical protein